MRFIGKRFFTALLFVSFLVGCQKAVEEPSFSIFSKEVILEMEGRNSEGAFVKLKDNSLAYVYSCFPKENLDHSKSDICIIKSSDALRENWSEPKVLLKAGKDVINIMSVSVIRQSEDVILLSFIEKRHRINETRIAYVTSRDELNSLSSVKYMHTYLGYNVVNNDRTLVDDGKLYVPISRHVKYLDSVFSYAGIPELYIAELQNPSYGKVTSLPIDTSIIMQEPGVVKLNSGCLLVWVRNNLKKILFSKSCDKGKTFSLWQGGGLDTVPFSPTSIKNIEGVFFVVYNKYIENKTFSGNPDDYQKHQSERSNLTLAISTDDLVSIEKSYVIESGDGNDYNYTAIHKEGNNLYLAYSSYNREEKTSAMKIVRLGLVNE